MLSKLFLDNFKAFGQPTEINLRPLTLIYGGNSAGKSTILQALLLLRQSFEVEQSAVSAEAGNEARTQVQRFENGDRRLKRRYRVFRENGRFVGEAGRGNEQS